ncbi:hypothetical protein N7326_01305 [Corynebacterium sp. ES2794-CONJ1]|uniref:hypothetical protein n=1 Tax=Corynebacterium sp. ES2794-CONJ1 TaxID=2980553 RepID=UPI0021D7DA09|nr:hypothetical protein [Corynebacterium sp. ES2794-CONJ1]MCU9518507.1 hypothetical protein [Corynebacterium sp. ES2794-CONJ1]
MSELEAIDGGNPQPTWPWPVVLVCCALLIFFFKIEGVLLSVFILAGVFLITKFQPNYQEGSALKSSISLSKEDIEDVLAEYDKFLHGMEADDLADRTIIRPALADSDCTEPDISEFIFLSKTSKRFVSRLDSRLRRNLSVTQLEELLKITDARALELQESWMRARRAAQRLGTDYKSS